MQLSRSPPNSARSKDVGGSMKGIRAAATSVENPDQSCSIDSSSSSKATSLTSLASLAATAASNAALTKYNSSKKIQGSTFGSSSSLNSNANAKSRLFESSTEHLLKPMYYQHSHAHSHGHHHNHHSHHNYHHYSHHGSSNSNGSGGSTNCSASAGNARSSMSSTGKRGRKKNWGTRERTGMSFLIVIAFFAVFGLIILTEFFMIDERSHSAMVMLRHGGSYGGRLGDSMPDYDNVKDDYELLDGKAMGDNKIGFVDFNANNDVAGPLSSIFLNSGGYGKDKSLSNGNRLGGANIPRIPWGKVLDKDIEDTLPPYPFGLMPTIGSWQVVNGTRFKFFVFSAYYDQRYGSRLVRVIGATRTRGPERVWCRFWYSNRNASSSSSHSDRHRYTSATVMARVKIIRENWNLKYSACFILCPVHGPEIEVPHFVSIVSRLRAPPGNLLTLKNTDWDEDFAVSTTQSNHSLSNQANATSALSASAATKPTSKIPNIDQIPDKIAVCVKPFHFDYDQALYLLEYMEFYALLGVSHFTFYNHTLGPHASCVLQHYIDGDVPDTLTASDAIEEEKDEAAEAPDNQANRTNGKQQQHQQAHTLKTSSNYLRPTVNILPWNLNMRSQKEIRTEGLFAALNDCVYRNMYRYKYLALVDLDEFIVPRHNDTLYDLISYLNRRFHNRNIGAYSFQNAFFYLQFPDDPLIYQKPAGSLDARMRAALVTQRKTKRRHRLHPQKQRSKYICKPEAVIEAGNHFIWEFAQSMGALNVAPTDAILQHYRVCEFGGNDCIKAHSEVDRTATKYVNRLVQRVQTAYEHLKKTCDLPDLPALPKDIPKMEDNVINNDSNNNNNDKVIKNKSYEKEKTIGNEKQNPLKFTTNIEKILATIKNQIELKTNETTIKYAKSTTKSNMTTTIKNIKKKNGDEKVPAQQSQYKRKVVVFENDENGLPKARLKFT